MGISIGQEWPLPYSLPKCLLPVGLQVISSLSSAELDVVRSKYAMHARGVLRIGSVLDRRSSALNRAALLQAGRGGLCAMCGADCFGLDKLLLDVELGSPAQEYLRLCMVQSLAPRYASSA